MTIRLDYDSNQCVGECQVRSCHNHALFFKQYSYGDRFALNAHVCPSCARVLDDLFKKGVALEEQYGRA